MAEWPTRGQKAPNFWDDDLKTYIDEGDAGSASGGREAATFAGPLEIVAVNQRTYELTLTGDAEVTIDGGGMGDQLNLAVYPDGHTLTIGDEEFTGSGIMIPVVLWLVNGGWYVTSGTSTLTGAPWVPSDTTPPGAPVNLVATPTSSTIVFTWDRPTSNGTDVDYYEFSIDDFATVQNFLDSNVIPRTYTFEGLSPSTAYTIKIRAVDLAGNVGAVAQVASTTSSGPPNTPPTAPTGLVMTSRTNTSINIDWNASTDDVGVVAYRVSKDGGATWISESITATDYSLTGLTPGTTYAIRVQAGDAAGAWSTSASLSQATTNTLTENAYLTYGFEDGSGKTDGNPSAEKNGGPTLATYGWGAGHDGGYGAGGGFALVPGGVDTNAWEGVTLMCWLDTATGLAPGTFLAGGHRASNWPTFFLKRTGPHGGMTSFTSILNIWTGASGPEIPTESLVTPHTAIDSSVGGRVWHHYATTWNKADGKWINYFDGVNIGERTLMGTFRTAHPVTAGGIPAYYTSYFGLDFTGQTSDIGKRDDIRIFDRALTPSEVATYMGQKVT